MSEDGQGYREDRKKIKCISTRIQFPITRFYGRQVQNNYSIFINILCIVLSRINKYNIGNIKKMCNILLDITV